MSGPPLEALTRRLAECPPELRAPPRVDGVGEVWVDAIVADVLVDLGGPLPPAAALASFGTGSVERLRLVCAAAWLLDDPWFRREKRFAQPAYALLQEGLDAVAALLPAERFITDPERREELVRLVLAHLELAPSGETSTQAADRLRALDTVQRDRVVKETRAKLEHARLLREAMARKEAEEAASRYGRE